MYVIDRNNVIWEVIQRYHTDDYLYYVLKNPLTGEQKTETSWKMEEQYLQTLDKEKISGRIMKIETPERPNYKVGDLLFSSKKDGYWFDHIIILGIDFFKDEYVYSLFTNDGEILQRTAPWVHQNYTRDENEAA